MQYAYLFRENSIDWDAQNNVARLKVAVLKTVPRFFANYYGFYIGQLSVNASNNHTSKYQRFTTDNAFRYAYIDLTLPAVNDNFYPTPIFLEDNGKKRGWRYSLDGVAPTLSDITLDYLFSQNQYNARPALEITYDRNPDVTSIYDDGYYIITDIRTPDLTSYKYTFIHLGQDGEAYRVTTNSYSFKFNQYSCFMRPDYSTFPAVLNRLTIDTDTDQPWAISGNPSYYPAGTSPIIQDNATTNPPPSTAPNYNTWNYTGFLIANKQW